MQLSAMLETSSTGLGWLTISRTSLRSAASARRAINMAQQPLPLQCHKLTERPWQRIGVDLFTFKNRQCRATVEYTSDYVHGSRYFVLNHHSSATCQTTGMFWALWNTLASKRSPIAAFDDGEKFCGDSHISSNVPSPLFVCLLWATCCRPV